MESQNGSNKHTYLILHLYKSIYVDGFFFSLDDLKYHCSEYIGTCSTVHQSKIHNLNSNVTPSTSMRKCVKTIHERTIKNIIISIF